MNNNVDTDIQQYKIIRCKDTLYSFKPYGILELPEDRYDVVWAGDCSLNMAKNNFRDVILHSKQMKQTTGKWFSVALIDSNNSIIAKE